MNRLFVLLISLTALAAGPGQSQEIIGRYYAAFGVQDYFSSSGTRLGSFAAVLQQDRANFHRFGKRDRYGDESDSVFGSRDMRARIPQLFDAGPNAWWARQPLRPPVRSPAEAEVLVFICGQGGRVSHIVVDHANGDGYRGC